MATSPSHEPQRLAEIQVRPRRSPKLVALGVLCVVLGALAAFAVYSMSVKTMPVVVTTRDIPRGHTLAATDMAIVDVPRTLATDATSAEKLANLIGLTVLFDLPKGSYPSSRHVGTPTIPAGHALVGLRLESGRIPMSPLVPGTPVTLVSVESGDTYQATLVTTPRAEQHTGFHTVDVAVTETDATAVAQSSATGALALVARGEN